MALSKPWSTLCLLSLSVPALGIASPFWFFSSAPDTCSKQAKTHVEESKCEAKCEDLKCDAPKPCCATKTYTEVVTVCENPCHPSHCNWDVALSVGIGYRHDRLHQKLHSHTASNPSSKRKYNDISSMMGVFRVDARVKNIMFAFEGDYAPEVGGTLDRDLTYRNNSAQNLHYKFRKLTGYEADAMLSVGYRLEFINGRHGKAYLVPQVGYRYSHQAWETYSQDDYVNRALAGGNVRNFAQDQSPLHSEWYGPYIEARASFVFWNHMHVDPFYQYYFLDHHSRQRNSSTSITIDPTLTGAPSTNQILTKINVENDSARGQSAGVDFFWQFDNQVRVGAKGSWVSFETRKARGHIKNTVTTYATNPPVSAETHFKEDAHTSWKSYSAYAYIGYAF